ncbi:hypothetical protein [Escherichia coli]|uniref:hypothetical protein n=1 Tax=Escherichia coli TaxID=562 RepID=UPI000D704D34|nr:hypothetical protein [Escherichia coli]
MINVNQLKKIRGASVLEQALSSGGSFLFFLVAARKYGIEDFGSFAYFFVGVQMLHGILLQWLFLPLVSINSTVSNYQLRSFSLRKLIIVLTFAPLFGVWYLYLYPDEVFFNSTWLLKFFVFSVSYCIFDYYKYLLIRNSLTIVVVLMQGAKWLMIATLMLFDTNIFNSFFVPISFICVIALTADVTCNRSHDVSHASSEKNIDDTSLYNPTPLLLFAICTNLQSIMLNVSLSWLSSSLLGALLAFRSATNVIPVILQYLEVHMSAKAVQSGANTIISRVSKVSLFTISAIFIAIASLHSKTIVYFVYGTEYGELFYIFPIMLVMVFVQSISRVVAAELRLKGKLDVFYKNAFILVASGITAMTVSFFRDSYDEPSSIILVIMVVTPIIQMLLLTFNNRARVSK